MTTQRNGKRWQHYQQAIKSLQVFPQNPKERRTLQYHVMLPSKHCANVLRFQFLIKTNFKHSFHMQLPFTVLFKITQYM